MSHGVRRPARSDVGATWCGEVSYTSEAPLAALALNDVIVILPRRAPVDCALQSTVFNYLLGFNTTLYSFGLSNRFGTIWYRYPKAGTYLVDG